MGSDDMAVTVESENFIIDSNANFNAITITFKKLAYVIPAMTRQEVCELYDLLEDFV